MKEFKYVITDPVGIHARPAGLVVKQASQFQSSIIIKKGERQADLKRLMAVMGLGIKKDEEIIIEFDGNDEEEAFEVITGFFKNNL